MEKTAPITYEPWRLFLGAGLLLGVGYLLIPDAATRNLVYNPINTLVVLTSAATVLYGVRKHRPVRKLPWFLLALALLAFAAGDATITVYENVLSIKSPFPSIADAFYLAMYPCLVAALLIMGRRSPGYRDGSDLIDPMICLVGITVLGLVYFMEPYAHNATTSVIEPFVGFIYMIMDVLLSFSLARFAFATDNRRAAHYLLGLSLIMLVLTEILYTVSLSSGMYRPGNLIDVGWLLFPTLIGCAALHPSMAQLFESATPDEAVLTRLRLFMLAGASLVPTGVLTIQTWRGVDFSAPLVIGGSILTFSLTILRLAGLMRAQERATRREEILRKISIELVAATNENGTYKAVHDAVVELVRDTSGVHVQLWVGSRDQIIAVSTDIEAEPATALRCDLDDLPQRILSCLLIGESVQATVSEVSQLQPLLNLTSKSKQIFIAPLRTREEVTGMIVVDGSEVLLEEHKKMLDTLLTHVTLTLQNLRLLEQSARQAGVLRERQRLAREIHDTVAQGFTSISMNLSAIQLEQATSPVAESVRSYVSSSLHIARESLSEARRLIWALRPESLNRDPLPQALAELAHRSMERSSVQVWTDVSGTPYPLLPEIETALMRVTQEALANIRKHSQANRAAITLSFIDNLVTLDIVDDGIGFDMASKTLRTRADDEGGFGLQAMEERVAAFGGTLLVESEPNSGTTLSVQIPSIADE